MSRLSSFLELQRGEARPVAHAFVVLALLVGGHTVLETARDALFLAALPPEQLNVVYLILAALSFLVVAESTALARRFGRRNALAGTLGVAAAAVVALRLLPQTHATVMALYVTSGLIGAALLPQFWLLTAATFTSAQGRRLFGPIASGGVVGAVVGAGGAALLLMRCSVSSLLLFAAATFGVSALVLVAIEPQASEAHAGKARERDGTGQRRPSAQSTGDAATGRALARRVALMIALSTAALLTADYLFKSTAARVIPEAELGSFFARYYAVTNAASLVVQIFVASRLVRRLGVAAAAGVMPFLMLLGGAASFVVAGAVLPVLALRLVDGAMRHSVHRVATELLYLPMPLDLRERTKSLVESVMTRVVQAAMAGALFALGMLGLGSPRFLAGIVVVLTAAWLAIAISVRWPYLDLFRRALARGTLDAGAGSDLDLGAAEVLVEAMANPDPDHVVAAMDLLEQRGRVKLVSALVLYHDAEVVLLRALEIFGRSERSDWFALAERLLGHASEDVRMAAVRALALRGRDSTLAKAADESSGCVQAYAAYHLARSTDGTNLLADARIAHIVEATGHSAAGARRGLLAAIADAPDARAVPVVLELVERGVLDDAVDVMHVARAMEALPDPRYVPHCVERMAKRKGREAVHAALAAHGDGGLAALQAVLDDPKAPRRRRVHAPWGIGVHATQAACDDLALRLATERDGFVRFKVLRGLGHVVATRDVTVDRAVIESHAQKELVEHLRLGALRLALGARNADPAADDPDAARALRLLTGLLRSKEDQSLERAFRLLKIANRREDIHRVHKAAVSTNRKARSDAGEFLDTLLGTRRQSVLRLLFRTVIDDLPPADRVSRAAPYLGRAVISAGRDHDAALALLVGDRDDAVAALAGAYALALGGGLHAATIEARSSQPSLASALGAALAAPAVGAVK